MSDQLSTTVSSIYNVVNLVVCAWDPVENLVNCHLDQVGLTGVLARRANVFPPPELFRQYRVPPLGPSHVLVHEADRHE